MTTTTDAAISHFADWPPESSGAPHAHVVILPGRGETVAGYRRLAQRISIDSVRTLVYGGPYVDALPQNDQDIGRLALEVLDALGDPGGKPVILIGSDSGALVALHLAQALRGRVTAVAVAGIPAGRAPQVGPAFDAELDLRSACTSYRGVLNSDENFRRGTVLQQNIPAYLWDSLSPKDIRVPVLSLQGEDDKLSDLASVKTLIQRIPKAQFAIVKHGRHDVLNDHDHRAVGSELAIFIQRARRGTELPLIVERHSDTIAQAHA